MTALTLNDVLPGVVVHLDTARLRVLGGSSSNAKNGMAVTGPHYFLILSIEVDLALTTPLFSVPGADRIKLEDSLKAGFPQQWLDRQSFYFKWQHWRIPIDALCDASSIDNSPNTNRRRYLGNPSLIARWTRKAREPWQAV